ncbi:MAG: hypothetical protein ACE1ZC_05820, partial [Nitrososphaerales archaeon]
ARWFHTGGIFAGLSETTPLVAKEAMSAARKHGTIVSYDLNYRPSLWKSIGGKQKAREVNRDLAPLVDVMLGNEEDFTAALGFEVEDEPELEEFPMPEEEAPQNALEAVIEGELSFAYLRYDEILSYVADGGIFPPEIRVYLPVEGSIISGGHAGIPFNAPNKSAALIFLDFLLSEEVQIEFVLELGKYPSIATITDDSLPERITASSIWIPRVEARGEWIPWPHFQYRVDLLDLWRNLTGE